MKSKLAIKTRVDEAKKADKIIVMDKGKVVEQGDHDTLLDKGGFYARLHQHQISDEEPAEKTDVNA